jgi:hypothetical protein
MHRFANGSRKRFGNVADSAPYNVFRGTGILGSIGVHSSSNLRKKIAGFELKVIIVKECHESFSPKARMK